MLRGMIVACCILGAAQAFAAEEVCVACQSPAATYRCSFKQTAQEYQLALGDAALAHICENVLRQAGAHGSCRVVKSSGPCNGTLRTVTVADYQRLVASDGHSTSQQGVLEKAQRCLTSFFGDC